MITLGQIISDSINRVITLTEDDTVLSYLITLTEDDTVLSYLITFTEDDTLCLTVVKKENYFGVLSKIDHISQMMTLTIISLRGLHCTVFNLNKYAAHILSVQSAAYWDPFWPG